MYKWKLSDESKFKIIDYEVPSSYVIKGIGGVDLLLAYGNEKFEDCKPAICFFEGSKQHEQYKTLKDKEEFQKILRGKEISVFYFSVKNMVR